MSKIKREINGYEIRKLHSNDQKKLISKLPFSLIAKNEKLSKQLYGIPVFKEFKKDMRTEEVKTTQYISQDYENFCNQLSSTKKKQLYRNKKKSIQKIFLKLILF